MSAADLLGLRATAPSTASLPPRQCEQGRVPSPLRPSPPARAASPRHGGTPGRARCAPAHPLRCSSSSRAGSVVESKGGATSVASAFPGHPEVSGEKAKNIGLQVLARIRGYADAAQAPQLFIEGGDDPAFFASRGSVFLGFIRATRRGPGLLHVLCNKDQPSAVTIDSCACAKKKENTIYTRLDTDVNQQVFTFPTWVQGLSRRITVAATVGVVLYNHSEADFAVKPGDCCTQMIIQVIATSEVAEVEVLDSTVRGEVLWRLNSKPW